MPLRLSTGHIQALTKDHEGALENLSRFAFHVVPVANDSLILGDCGPVGFSDDMRDPRRIFDRKVQLICLPLNHSRLLVGSKAAGSDVEIAGLNEASAAVSGNFFVSSLRRDDTRLLT